MKKHKKRTQFFIILIASIFLFLSFAAYKYFSGCEIYRDVRYGEKEVNVMDIYIPEQAYKRENNGCVLFIHGGSWSGGDKKEEAARCRLLASRGYITATVNYTLWDEKTAEEYTVFGVLDEIDTALLRLKEFAIERGITITKAATSGYSAGAHLSMLYSYSRVGVAPMEIVFTANMAGPSDISADVWGADMAMAIAKRLTGKNVTQEMLLSGEADELLSSISPTAFVCDKTPPTVIIHGGKDTVVPLKNAEVLMEKLSQYSVAYDYIYLGNSDHSLIQNPLKHAKYLKKLLEYCKRYFGA